MRIALYEPDIPQNTGTLLRLGACMGVPLDLIGPYGFILSDKALRRAGMDYLAKASFTEHESWRAFLAARPGGRLVLLTTSADTPYTQFRYRADDTLLLGRESAGVPIDVHQQVDATIVIPMLPDARSLNVALAGAMVLGEALRQTSSFPTPG